MSVDKPDVIYDPFGIPFSELPENLPIFPLPGAMLLPHGRMPLNIFEPRYIKMVIDSLKQSRLIGMVQPLEFLPGPIPDKTPLFHIGCAGRITNFAEIDDGRLMITLQGICRFKIEKELENKNTYRQIKPDFNDFKKDLSIENPIINREKIFRILNDYLKLKDIDVNAEDLLKIENRFLIPTLVMINPFDFREKQAILETHNMGDIADIIISLMEMDINSPNQPSTKH